MMSQVMTAIFAGQSSNERSLYLSISIYLSISMDPQGAYLARCHCAYIITVSFSLSFIFF